MESRGQGKFRRAGDGMASSAAPTAPDCRLIWPFQSIQQDPAMSFSTLLVNNDNAVRTIAINRPDKLNALNQQVISELHVAFGQAAHDDAVRVIVLTG